MLRVVAPSAASSGGATTSGLGPGLLFVGRYRLDKRIGRGGMGEVWVATDVTLERVVAAKFIHPRLASEPVSLTRFLREMKSLAKLEHPNIVRLYASDVDPQPYMIMELVRGITLREILCVGGRIEPMIAVCYAIQIVDGLGAAHRAKLSHRDIKPENIIVSDDGRGHVWILDFGIAQSTEGRRHGETTDRLGSLGYIPPEMALSRPMDHRGDFYQLGVVLYEMLTGRKPYSDVDESSETEMQAAHAYTAPDPILAIVPECPEPLWHVVAKLLAKDPPARYQNADEIIAALRAILRVSAPPQHPLALMVQRELVRKKLSSRPAPESEPANDEHPCETVSGVRVVSTEPLGPMAVAPSPCAPNEEGNVGQRRTIPLSPDFVASSPASPASVRAASPRAEVASAPRETMSIPPGLVAAARAPFPLLALKAPRAVGGAWSRARLGVIAVGLVAVAVVALVRSPRAEMPVSTTPWATTSAAPQASAPEVPPPAPSLSAVAPAAPAASSTRIDAKPSAARLPAATSRTPARPVETAPPPRASGRAFDVEGDEPTARPAKPKSRGGLPFE